PNSDRSLFAGLSGLFGGGSQAPVTPAPQPQQPQWQAQPSAPPAPQTSSPGYAPPPQAGTNPRPPVTQTSARPEAAAGLDGWLVDRLFGGRR
ncbi:hypothetical protein ACGE32_30840, partial [Klebsiella pneumoniae]